MSTIQQSVTNTVPKHISPTIPQDVAYIFEMMPESAQKVLLTLRALIFETAESTDGVNIIIETLKWGQPSYITTQPKSGTPIRLGLNKSKQPTIFVHCQTSLIREFRDIYPEVFDFEGNRALILKQGTPLPEKALIHCIARALTYHIKA